MAAWLGGDGGAGVLAPLEGGMFLCSTCMLMFLWQGFFFSRPFSVFPVSVVVAMYLMRKCG